MEQDEYGRKIPTPDNPLTQEDIDAIDKAILIDWLNWINKKEK